MLHGVQHVFHPLDFLPEWPDRDRHTRLVFIVQDVTRRWIECLLDAIDSECKEISERLRAGLTRG